MNSRCVFVGSISQSLDQVKQVPSGRMSRGKRRHGQVREIEPGRSAIQAPADKIPHRKVGTHRRIRMEDVVAYKNAIDRDREQVLEQLAREGQARDMGYVAR